MSKILQLSFLIKIKLIFGIIYFLVSLIVLNSGLVNGWSSPYLAQLTSMDSKSSLKLSDFEASWVASLLNLGRLIGAFTGAFMQGDFCM